MLIVVMFLKKILLEIYAHIFIHETILYDFLQNNKWGYEWDKTGPELLTAETEGWVYWGRGSDSWYMFKILHNKTNYF